MRFHNSEAFAMGGKMTLTGEILVQGSVPLCRLTPVHAHPDLVGWASLALFALVYRVYPELAAKRLALVHVLLSATSAVLLPVGIGLAVLRNQPGLAIAASCCGSRESWSFSRSC
jgi:hypothetical protein